MDYTHASSTHIMQITVRSLFDTLEVILSLMTIAMTIAYPIFGDKYAFLVWILAVGKSQDSHPDTPPLFHSSDGVETISVMRALLLLLGAGRWGR